MMFVLNNNGFDHQLRFLLKTIRKITVKRFWEIYILQNFSLLQNVLAVYCWMLNVSYVFTEQRYLIYLRQIRFVSQRIRMSRGLTAQNRGIRKYKLKCTQIIGLLKVPALYVYVFYTLAECLYQFNWTKYTY